MSLGKLTASRARGTTPALAVVSTKCKLISNAGTTAVNRENITRQTSQQIGRSRAAGKLYPLSCRGEIITLPARKQAHGRRRPDLGKSFTGVKPCCGNS